ncbi:acyl-CoA carboxylase subunit epsilon [Actinomadura sp. KC06]|uniref:acyl-CoA carboxylase epsilon subunit n=1 Tax=Actinomadura sp. KC06 TaxID=2530369 RepID=UPI00104D1345|nr:acyl-CoA carboxylase epsilon subunit [Actinomadura sp. KC06]TDD34574.1 acyl-CoA carboxylase subunit epsilon [Actinomadura sp. KC06]
METERNPVLRVVRGEPGDEEIAAVVVALLAVAGRGRTAADGAGATRARPAPRWSPRPYRSPRAWTSG